MGFETPYHSQFHQSCQSSHRIHYKKHLAKHKDHCRKQQHDVRNDDLRGGGNNRFHEYISSLVAFLYLDQRTRSFAL